MHSRRMPHVPGTAAGVLPPFVGHGSEQVMLGRKKTTTPKKGTRSKPRASGNRMSALDAAAKVLAKAAEPLSTRH